MKTLNLLLLEDDIDDANLIVTTLERSGMDFTYTVVCNRESYLKSLTNHLYDAILADNSLPQFNSVNALKQYKLLGLTIPFILVTGSISEEYAVDIMKDGAWDYILKDRLQRLPSAILSAVHQHMSDMERQKYLDDIIKNESLMKEAERLAHFGSWEADIVNNTERWSDEYYRILGYTPGEVTPSVEHFLARVHESDIMYVSSLITDAYNTKDRQQFNCRVVDGFALVKYIRCELFIIRDIRGNIVRVNGMCRDVTATIHAEEMLQNSEANLRTIFNNTDTGYLLLDTACKIVSYNKPISEFADEHLNKEILNGEDALSYFPSERAAIVKQSLDSVFNNIVVFYEMPYLAKDGSNRWYHFTYHPVLNADKVVIGAILSQTDITARKMMELQEKLITAELIQRKNELEQFTYIVSHNLRAPVANILGIMYLLKDEDFPESEKKALFGGLNTSVKKLDEIIVDLNHILQVKQSVAENKERVFFSILVEDIKISIGNIVNDKQVEISYSFKDESMYTVKSYLYSIFYNLISNSIKYRQLDLPLKINISSERIVNTCRLVFTDNGVGIDLEKKGHHVFGLYKRFHTTLAEGKGMGLFMVKTHVETLSGRISIKSEVNVGTEFQIDFDLDEAAQTDVVPLPSDAPATLAENG
ncbi:MAG: PAS domain S-box protein [Taibaiella sp.]|nr:PAS domain S-box protein [Taibaiella sp.]